MFKFMRRFIFMSNICGCLVSKSSLNLCDPMDCSTPGFPVLHYLQNLLKFTSIESVLPSNHLILCHSLLLLLSMFARFKVFSNGLVLHIKWANSWNLPQYQPLNEYSGLISFRIDWLDLLAIQGTLNSILQYHNSKASILQLSVIFMVQLSHLYMTVWKNSFDYTDLCWQSNVSVF